ncbi:MAG: sulfatase-like hydrolase/transferase [Anaerolineae bacterium]|nr:sulfatase-like hydrolase/transferase [Anaerolineae bacterium]
MQPNIILMMTDHFRRDALGRSTPNLVALANRGTRFENAYCGSPLCGPSRVTVVTGLFPSQHGVSGNQAEPIRPELRDDTFMHHLQDAGYYTAMIGKHHYIDRYGLGIDSTQDTDEIKRYGFDHVFIVADDGENGHNDDEYTHYLRQKGLLETFRQALSKRDDPFKHPLEPDDTADGFIGTNGVRFIEQYDREQPFYLNLSFIGPHPPLWHPNPPAHDPAAMPAPIGAPDDPRTRERRAHYMDKCALIDGYIGRLVDTLEQRDMLENTVIVFTSDHGDNLGDYGIWDKRYFYELSVGVPFFMCGPGIPAQERMNGPRVSRSLVSHLDLYPTFLELAGASMPSSPPRAGRSILHAPAHRAIYAELATSAMIRTGNWKLVFDPEQGGVTYLFNLLVDPQEQQNLAGVAGYEHVTLDLVQRLLEHRIRLTQYTHIKEEQRLQRVRIGP